MSSESRELRASEGTVRNSAPNEAISWQAVPMERLDCERAPLVVWSQSRNDAQRRQTKPIRLGKSRLLDGAEDGARVRGRTKIRVFAEYRSDTGVVSFRRPAVT